MARVMPGTLSGLGSLTSGRTNKPGVRHETRRGAVVHVPSAGQAVSCTDSESRLGDCSSECSDLAPITPTLRDIPSEV